MVLTDPLLNVSVLGPVRALSSANILAPRVTIPYRTKATSFGQVIFSQVKILKFCFTKHYSHFNTFPMLCMLRLYINIMQPTPLRLRQLPHFHPNTPPRTPYHSLTSPASLHHHKSKSLSPITPFSRNTPTHILPNNHYYT